MRPNHSEKIPPSGSSAITSTYHQTILSLRKSGKRFTFNQLLEIISNSAKHKEFDISTLADVMEGEIMKGTLVVCKRNKMGQEEFYFRREHPVNQNYEHIDPNKVDKLSEDIKNGKETVRGRRDAGSR
jgi:hypothetical protein